MTDDGLDALSPGEQRLLSLLVLLREQVPRPGEQLTEAIMRQARRQHLLRRVGETLATLLGGITDGLALLLGLGPRAAPATA